MDPKDIIIYLDIILKCVKLVKTLWETFKEMAKKKSLNDQKSDKEDN